MAKDSDLKPTGTHRVHPYAYVYPRHRHRISPDTVQKAPVSDEERLLASADLMAGRVDELLAELQQANSLGVILTYDKNSNGWELWFR